MFAVGQKVEVLGRALNGEVGGFSDCRTPISTFVYALKEGGRGWYKTLHYWINQESLTGTVVSIDDNAIEIELDAKYMGMAFGQWSLKPYKRVDGSRAPNVFNSGFTEKVSEFGYGINLKGSRFAIDKKSINVIRTAA